MAETQATKFAGQKLTTEAGQALVISPITLALVPAGAIGGYALAKRLQQKDTVVAASTVAGYHVGGMAVNATAGGPVTNAIPGAIPALLEGVGAVAGYNVAKRVAPTTGGKALGTLLGALAGLFTSMSIKQ